MFCLLCLYVVLSCVGRGLCNGLITRPEESYRVSNCMHDHTNPERGPVFQLGTKGKLMNCALTARLRRSDIICILNEQAYLWIYLDIAFRINRLNYRLSFTFYVYCHLN
jgi:hypothetical protein